jgi:hypothetical protein
LTIAALAPIASAAVASDHRDLGAQRGAATTGLEARTGRRERGRGPRDRRARSPRQVGAADAGIDDLDEQPLKPGRGQTTSETAASKACDAS